MKELIKQLSDMRAISGHEYRIIDEIKKLFKPYADDIYTDALGSVIAVKRCGKKNAKRIMIEGHCDEIGLMVSGIDERGFLSFVNIGGVDPRILPSAEVVVHGTEDLLGVIGAKPPHLQSAGEADKSAKIMDMAIDIGMNREEALKIVSIGDAVTLSQSCGELLGGQLSGKTLDDRAGIASVISVLKNLSKVKLSVDIYAVASVQEEVGCRGAKTAAYGISPDLAVVIDVCHGVTPDNSENAFENGSGTVISLGPNIHPKVAKRLIKTAEKYDIKTNIDVDGGDTGTDAWVIQIAGNGVPTALLSIPLKYMHTSVETMAVSDVKATVDLLTSFIQNLDDDLEGWLCY